MSTIIDEGSVLEGEPDHRSIWPTATTYGLILAATSFVLTLLAYNLGWMDIGDDGQPANSWATILGYVATAVIAYLGLKAFRGDSAGRAYLPTKRGIKWSAAFGLVTGLAAMVLNFVFFQLIAPDYLGDMSRVAEASMEDQGMTGEQLEQGMSMMGMFLSPGYLALFALLGAFLGAFIIGSLITLFVKTE